MIITLTPPQNITSIDVGTSTPKLGGVIDVSGFTNLQEIRCNGHDLTEVKGYADLPNIKKIVIADNLLTALPSLTGNTNLTSVDCSRNNISQVFPDLSSNTNLRVFLCFRNQLSGNVFDISSNLNMDHFGVGINNLTGTIPSLSANTNLKTYNVQQQTPGLTGGFPSIDNLLDIDIVSCTGNALSGSLPNLSNNTKLRIFQFASNSFTGNIPDLSNNTQLQLFECYNNNLSGYAGGTITSKLSTFRGQSNILTQSAVNSILAAFVAAGHSGGLLNLGGSGNAAPTNGNSNSDKLVLEARGWTVIVTP